MSSPGRGRCRCWQRRWSGRFRSMSSATPDSWMKRAVGRPPAHPQAMSLPPHVRGWVRHGRSSRNHDNEYLDRLPHERASFLRLAIEMAGRRRWNFDKVDIDKMHAYRDAIRDGAGTTDRKLAATLYPGRSERFGPGIAAIRDCPGDRPTAAKQIERIMDGPLNAYAAPNIPTDHGMNEANEVLSFRRERHTRCTIGSLRIFARLIVASVPYRRSPSTPTKLFNDTFRRLGRSSTSRSICRNCRIGSLRCRHPRILPLGLRIQAGSRRRIHERGDATERCPIGSIPITTTCSMPGSRKASRTPR